LNTDCPVRETVCPNMAMPPPFADPVCCPLRWTSNTPTTKMATDTKADANAAADAAAPAPAAAPAMARTRSFGSPAPLPTARMRATCEAIAETGHFPSDLSRLMAQFVVPYEVELDPVLRSANLMAVGGVMAGGHPAGCVVRRPARRVRGLIMALLHKWSGAVASRPLALCAEQWRVEFRTAPNSKAFGAVGLMRLTPSEARDVASSAAAMAGGAKPLAVSATDPSEPMSVFDVKSSRYGTDDRRWVWLAESGRWSHAGSEAKLPGGTSGSAGERAREVALKPLQPLGGSGRLLAHVRFDWRRMTLRVWNGAEDCGEAPFSVRFARLPSMRRGISLDTVTAAPVNANANANAAAAAAPAASLMDDETSAAGPVDSDAGVLYPYFAVDKSGTVMRVLPWPEDEPPISAEAFAAREAAAAANGTAAVSANASSAVDK
jgi:hypothetical protein